MNIIPEFGQTLFKDWIFLICLVKLVYLQSSAAYPACLCCTEQQTLNFLVSLSLSLSLCPLRLPSYLHISS